MASPTVRSNSLKIAGPLVIVSLLSCSEAQFKPRIEKQTAQKVLANHSLFIAGRKANEDMSFAFLPNSALQTLTLETNPLGTNSYKQIERPLIVDEFIQGHRGDEVKEDFTIATLDKLDLLVVVDNSSSMGSFQAKLSAGLKPLLSHISNTDWHMMVTTTSAIRKRNPVNPAEIVVTYGCPRVNASDSTDKAVITRQDYLQNASAVSDQFTWKVLGGENGDPIERGLLAATSALKGECGDEQKAWTRIDSHKAVLMLTDEENCGSDPDQNCDTAEDSKPEFFLNGAPKGTQFFALLHDKDRYVECQDQDYIRKPEDYRALIAQTGGLEGNICAGQYDAMLEVISSNMHPVARKSFTLGFDPENKDVAVLVDGVSWNGAFQVNGRELVISDGLPVGAKTLSVVYRHNAVPMSSQFPLTQTADPETLEVLIKGVALPSNDYSLISNKLFFKTEPKELSRIEVRYRQVQNLPRVFAFSKDALLSTVGVSVNNAPTKNFRIASDGIPEVLLSEAPKDGAQIVISYETESTRILSYQSLDFAAGEVRGIKAVDAASGDQVIVKASDGKLVFNRSDVLKGRIVNVSYDLAPKSTELKLNLKQLPIEGSLNVQVSEGGQQCAAQMSLSGTNLSFPCASDDLGRLQISYDYVTSIDSSFRLSGTFTQWADWIVKVNGVQTQNYSLDRNVLSFSGQTFVSDTQVEVEVWETMVLPLEK